MARVLRVVRSHVLGIDDEGPEAVDLCSEVFDAVREGANEVLVEEDEV